MKKYQLKYESGLGAGQPDVRLVEAIEAVKAVTDCATLK